MQICLVFDNGRQDAESKERHDSGNYEGNFDDIPDDELANLLDSIDAARG